MADTAMTAEPLVMTDPEWIALESLDEKTERFIFGEAMLHLLQGRGLAEPRGEHWNVTRQGQRALESHAG